MILATRIFTLADQHRFASVSGDHNPMHADALYARRTQAGAPVVHGINLLLWALDSLALTQRDLRQLRSLRVRFNKFIYLEELVQAVFTQQEPSKARVTISVDGAPRSIITLEFGDLADHAARSFAATAPQLPVPLTPSVRAFEQIVELSGRLSFQLTHENSAALFPAATTWLGFRRIAALACSTQLIGMVCPGLHSIYDELSIKICREVGLGNSLAFRVIETDPRFQSVAQEIVGGGLIGVVKSFFRAPPVPQITIQSLAGVVGPAEFAGSVALIIGGSRGLGELTAKAIAAGGGHVIVTWNTGKDDADKVVQEIRSAGGMCDALAYDANKSASEQLASMSDVPTHAYYFATPAIFRPQSSIFARGRLEEFLSIYVSGFWQLVQALRARKPAVSIFYPSSVSITERPRGMTEYTMAKSAGEVLCADINSSMSPTHVSVVRLPRLLTDQTVTLAAAETSHSLETMLPIIREVQSWPRSS
jgi:NAD(P)-dependent dehydrogenase (short-subunit alcohol dehydrogenase family)